MADHLIFGKKGEKIASDFLVKKGYEILETNWRYKHLEVDLIASDDNKLIIVEVKSRDAAFWESADQVITNGKIKFLVDATEAYIEMNQIDMEVRFDVICIISQGESFQIEHIMEAFHPIVNH